MLREAWFAGGKFVTDEMLTLSCPPGNQGRWPTRRKRLSDSFGATNALRALDTLLSHAP